MHNLARIYFMPRSGRVHASQRPLVWIDWVGGISGIASIDPLWSEHNERTLHETRAGLLEDTGSLS